MARARSEHLAVLAAADAHVEAVSDVFLGAVGAARRAVDGPELERAVRERDWSAVERVMDAALSVLSDHLAPDLAGKAPGDARGLEPALRSALEAGAAAVELCAVRPKP